MRSLRHMTSVCTLAAVAALLGASCASSGQSMKAGDDTSGDPPKVRDQASEERTDESLDCQSRRYPAPAPGSGFTFSCAGFWNGVWCGGNLGFPGSPYALYYCYNGTGQLIATCPGRCVAGPSGVEDHC